MMANSVVNDNSRNILVRALKRVKNGVSGFFSHPETVPCEHLPKQFGYIFRRKSRWELTRISSTVCGIEFCYAAETAFVTPVLLSLGLNVKYVSMIWCLSPLLAFILTPLLGSLSDGCRSRFGRRRPFIFMLSVGTIIGLVFVPFGGRIGILLGDEERDFKIVIGDYDISENNTQGDLSNYLPLNESKAEMLLTNRIPNNTLYSEEDNIKSHIEPNTSYHLKILHFDNVTLNEDSSETNSRLFGIIFTVIGTVFLDLCADVCQSPCRAYLLDITIPKEQAAGLAIFSLNSGIGSAVGYGIAAVKWDISLWDNVLEGQVIISFAILSSLYLLFVSTSLLSFPEIPLPLLDDPLMFKEYQEKKKNDDSENNTEMRTLPKNKTGYSSIEENGISLPTDNKDIKENNGVAAKACEINFTKDQNKDPLKEEESSDSQMSVKDYLKSIIFMPKSIRILCLTNFFFGMGVISYTIFFTDFVGECVFNGDPHAPKHSKSYELYKEGVRFGSWGMAFSSLCCAIYASLVEDLAKRFGAKSLFIGGALAYSVGMALMAITRHKVAAILLSSTTGIMLTTLSTLPYILVAHYHSSQKFKEDSKENDEKCKRGIGTDVATVISVIVLSQCILSLGMGTVVNAVGSNIVVMCSAAIFSFCGAISATQIMYLDM